MANCRTCGHELVLRGRETYCEKCESYVWNVDEKPDPKPEPKPTPSSKIPGKVTGLKPPSLLPDNSNFAAPQGELMPNGYYRAVFAFCREARQWADKWLVYFRVITPRFSGNEIFYPVKPPDPDKKILSNANLHHLIQPICRANGGGFNPPLIITLDDLQSYLSTQCDGLVFKINSERKFPPQKRPYSRIKFVEKVYRSGVYKANTESRHSGIAESEHLGFAESRD